MNAKIQFPQTAKTDVYATRTIAGIPASRVLGVPISTINMDVAVCTVLDWVSHRNAQYICVRDVHGVMRAQEDPALLDIHDGAGLITPDGMPLVWTLKARGYNDAERVCGADLVAALCAASVSAGTRHYLYGGKPGVAERMAVTLTGLFPGLLIVGSSTPPFRPMTSEEDEAAIVEISATRPDVVWVGLSTPKQEYWMRDHVGRIPGATLVGIGAAFDFYAGDVKRAPRWMHNNGLEWLHRLISEPRRLWRRYLILAPKFLVLMVRGAVLARRQVTP
ncbi:WecB/TagA/CpsF family glycosyltransferase [Sphingobium sp. CECT 9361]|uniref:WecB/TagA/CpsF family glycosyltransferase n=1 Tax=Sphingobium sp. CECT 9361 TaxID=2845384 RepID=UPI001E5F4B1A|nr:WecB/TagA/CpsF family glycosyltransferase [Sphingobium sp. CECT 9361]CAH0356909.1 N-acetylglucosaminyldiphosphoundecaprenol N-acetyl-beta-D-mannosaminyltransferase [Sphingobium sp. CECT 9361]